MTTRYTAQQIRELLDGATPGPWAYYGDGGNEVYSEAERDGEYIAEGWVAIPYNGPRVKADAALIAAAPALAAQLLELLGGGE